MPKRSHGLLDTTESGRTNLDVLRAAFSKVYSLHDFLQQHVSDEVLLRPDDSEKYARVLKTSIVGIQDEAALRIAANCFRAVGASITPSSRKIKEVTGITVTVPLYTNGNVQILDVVVTELLSKSRRGSSQNIITLGFSKNNTEGTTALTNIVQEYASSHYRALCAAEWQLLLERVGDSAMIFLLTNTCIFFEFGNQCFHQAVGFPIYDIKAQTYSRHTKRRFTGGQALSVKALTDEPDHLTKINTVVINRHQMLYTNPRIKPNGQVTFGLYPQNCLGRYGDHTNVAHTKSVLKNVFRKQYGLKNVFDMAAYGQALPKRGLLYPHVEPDDMERKKPLPRTLKGPPFELFRQIQHRQEKCPYGILIQYYCPLKDSPLFARELSSGETSSPVVKDGNYETNNSTNFLHNATKHNRVAAFVKSVVKKLLPAKTFGSETNWHILLKHIDTYVSLGRYEKFTMHGLIQGIRIREIKWLGINDCSRLPLGEYNKRSFIL
ncbi:hypothetical protein V1517DRAFT_122761 [Lipomyces orientalis]|uniref:Uncharacterized protein n=1 Tax=Lipomyces orientalis TaxID=1233043 RepID=A0ACC3TRA3_9ASCO